MTLVTLSRCHSSSSQGLEQSPARSRCSVHLLSDRTDGRVNERANGLNGHQPCPFPTGSLCTRWPWGPLYPTPLGEEENRREGGEANFRLECRLIQSAGKNDNGGGFGSLGNWRGEAEVGPFTQSGKVMAPAECRRGAGRGAQLLNGRLAGPARASVPSWEPAQPRAVSVSSKQEKS